MQKEARDDLNIVQARLVQLEQSLQQLVPPFCVILLFSPYPISIIYSSHHTLSSSYSSHHILFLLYPIICTSFIFSFYNLFFMSYENNLFMYCFCFLQSCFSNLYFSYIILVLFVSFVIMTFINMIPFSFHIFFYCLFHFISQ